MSDEYKIGISEEGLKAFFKVGESFYWKRFEFKVAEVGFDYIILRPVSYKKSK